MGTPDRDNYEMAPQTDDRDVEKAKQVEEDESGWTGLGKDELLQVADTPAWNWTRNILLVLFWVTWVAMLIAAIWIVVTVPRCPDVEWWEKNVVYQVNPRLFSDSNGDGIGDLKGLKSRLSHLEETGVKILYINSIFAQPESNTTVYTGKDVVDFKSIDETLGTMEDFTSLITDATDISVKVIIEFIPNHSSDQHPWFLESKMNTTGPRTDYYIWAAGDSTSPPGSQTMGSGDPAWTYVDSRAQWYYHSDSPSRPDLNYDNADLQKDITEAMDFWLDKGVDGIVITNVDSVVDSDILSSLSRKRRQAVNGTAGNGTDPMATSLAPVMTTIADAMTTIADAMPTDAPDALPGTDPTPEPESTIKYTNLEKDELLKKRIDEWRVVFVKNSYLGKYRLLLTSGADSVKSAVMQYGDEDTRLADFPLNTQFLDVITDVPSGIAISKAVNDWFEAKAAVDESTSKRWNSWMNSNSDLSRVASRCGIDLVNALNTLLLTLPGTPIVLYGEELGLVDSKSTSSAQNSPMPWNKAANGNFTTGDPYTELADGWETNNVVAQLAKDDSHLNQFKKLVTVHLEPPVVAGTFEVLVATEDVFAYVRKLEDWPTYLVVINFSGTSQTVALPEDKVQEEGEVVHSTDNNFSDEKTNARQLNVAAKQAVILKFKAVKEE